MNSDWSYRPEMHTLGQHLFDLCDLDLYLLTLTFCMDITFVIGINFCKFHDDTDIMKKFSQTDISVPAAAWLQLKIDKYLQAKLNIAYIGYEYQLLMFVKYKIWIRLFSWILW